MSTETATQSTTDETKIGSDPATKLPDEEAAFDTKDHYEEMKTVYCDFGNETRDTTAIEKLLTDPDDYTFHTDNVVWEIERVCFGETLTLLVGFSRYSKSDNTYVLLSIYDHRHVSRRDADESFFPDSEQQFVLTDHYLEKRAERTSHLNQTQVNDVLSELLNNPETVSFDAYKQKWTIKADVFGQEWVLIVGTNDIKIGPDYVLITIYPKDESFNKYQWDRIEQFDREHRNR